MYRLGEVSGWIDLGSAADAWQKGAKSGGIPIETRRMQCDKADAVACYVLAHAYLSGWGIGKDDKMAFRYAERSCELGSALGCFQTGVQYNHGLGVPRDSKKVAEPPSQACDAGDGQSCGMLASKYEKGRDFPLDFDRAAALHQKGCAARDANSCYQAGLRFAMGKGKDLPKAMEFFQKACDAKWESGCAALKGKW